MEIYDCEGKPLKEGDVVIVISAIPLFQRFVGRIGTVACFDIRKENIFAEVRPKGWTIPELCPNWNVDQEAFLAHGSHLKKLDENRLDKSNDSFEDLINKLKTETPKELTLA